MATRGSGNVLLTPDLIANMTMWRQKNHLFLPLMASREYEPIFQSQVTGGEIKVKRPYYAEAKKGRSQADSELQAIFDIYETISVDQWWSYGLKYNAREATLDLKDLEARYFSSGKEELAYMYDIAGAKELGQISAYMEGTPGSGLTPQTVWKVTAHAEEVSIPMMDRSYGIVHPQDIVSIGESLISPGKEVTKFNVADNQTYGYGYGWGPGSVNAPDIVNSTIRKYFQGMLGGWEIYQTTHLPYMTVAAKPNTPQVRGANQRDSSIDLKGFGASSKAFNKGQLIQFAGVYETEIRGERKNNGRLMTFTVTADVTADAAGNCAVPISPWLNDGMVTRNDGDGNAVTLQSMKNVTATPANNAAVMIMGDAGKRYRQSVFFDHGALHYVNVIIEIPEACPWQGQAMDPETGLSIAVMGDFDFNNVVSKRRADAFFGTKLLRPELALRVLTTSF